MVLERLDRSDAHGRSLGRSVQGADASVDRLCIQVAEPHRGSRAPARIREELLEVCPRALPAECLGTGVDIDRGPEALMRLVKALVRHIQRNALRKIG